MAVLPKGFPAFPLEVQACGIEKHQIQGAEQIAIVFPAHTFFRFLPKLA
jgi:hypothetical protein